MNTEKRQCQNCKEFFQIEPDDFAFYEKIGVPLPSMCPQCRARQRLAFRNERSFYKRPCDKCKRGVISMYSPNKPYTVWCHDCWFADDWDAIEYAREYDPSRPIFEQFEELWKYVPKVSLVHIRSINSEYLNICADNKDCYMLVESSDNEGVIHGYWIQQSRDCIDTSFSHQLELSYETDNCYKSSRLMYSKGCEECLNGFFLLDCRNCSDCIGCVNLRNKKHCVFNEQLTKEAYAKFLAEAKLYTYDGVEKLRKDFEVFVLAQPHKFAESNQIEQCTGNYIYRARRCRQCFHCYDAEDSAYGVHIWRDAKDCMDADTVGRGAEMVYNSVNTALLVSHCIGCALCWEDTFCNYSMYCFNSNNLFGCVGLRKKNYCILNKQYPREEYEKLKCLIIQHMQDNSTYGEFFPPNISCFGYNESAAQEQFPLTKEQALAMGFKWEDTKRGTYGKENDKDIFACVECKKNYRIIPREFEFYQRFSIPLPRLCPDCRHARRFAARGPNRLWNRQCAKCKTPIQTSYSPERPEIIYCESCYRQEVA